MCKTYGAIVKERMIKEGGKYFVIYLFAVVPVVLMIMTLSHGDIVIVSSFFFGLLALFLSFVLALQEPWRLLVLFLFLAGYLFISCIKYKAIRVSLYCIVLFAWSWYSTYCVSQF